MIYFTIILALIFRIFYHFKFSNLNFHIDSATYLEIAYKILYLDFKSDREYYEALRPPGYSLIIVLSFFNQHLLVIVQTILSIIGYILCFNLSYKITNNFLISYIILVLLLFDINGVNYERTVQTETISTFLNCLVVYLTYIAKTRNSNKLKIAISLLIAFSVLVRPNLISNIILLFWLSKTFTELLKLVFPTIIFIIFWSYINYINTGYFIFTTLTYNLYFFFKSIDKEKLIKDLKIQTMADSVIVSLHGKPPAQIIFLLKDILNVRVIDAYITFNSFVTKQLMPKYKYRYINSVISNFPLFFSMSKNQEACHNTPYKIKGKAFVYIDCNFNHERCKIPQNAQVLWKCYNSKEFLDQGSMFNKIWNIQGYIYNIITKLFLIIIFIELLLRPITKHIKEDDFISIIVSYIIFSAFITVLSIAYLTSRYTFPFQPFIFMFVFYKSLKIFSIFKK